MTLQCLISNKQTERESNISTLYVYRKVQYPPNIYHKEGAIIERAISIIANQETIIITNYYPFSHKSVP